MQRSNSLESTLSLPNHIGRNEADVNFEATFDAELTSEQEREHTKVRFETPMNCMKRHLVELTEM